jgi:hypothetical protein
MALSLKIERLGREPPCKQGVTGSNPVSGSRTPSVRHQPGANSSRLTQRL